MDKYMKFVLTIIAVGIIGINFQLFGGDIISKANANHWTTHGGSMKFHTVIENWPTSITCK